MSANHFAYPSIRPDLLRSCADSDSEREIWIELVETLRPRIRGTIETLFLRVGRFPTREVVDDLEQEVYCRLLERDRAILRQFRGSSPGEAGQYIRRISASVTFDFFAAESAKKRTPPASQSPARPGEPWASPPVCRLPLPEQVLLESEAVEALWNACREILAGQENPPERLEVLRRVWYHGSTSREVAEASRGSWSPSKVSSLVARTRRRLRANGSLDRIPRPWSRR